MSYIITFVLGTVVGALSVITLSVLMIDGSEKNE